MARAPARDAIAPTAQTARSAQPAPLVVQPADACSPTRSARALELLRDPIRLGFSLFGTALLMLVFGFGVSTDVNNLSFAVLDHDQSPGEPRLPRGAQGLELFRGEAAARRLWRDRKSHEERGHTAAIEIPPGFGRDIKRGRPAWVGAWVDGAMPFRAETIRGYLQGMHELYLTDPAVKTTAARRARRPPISNSGSNTTRISTASMRWCLRPQPYCSACFPRS